MPWTIWINQTEVTKVRAEERGIGGAAITIQIKAWTDLIFLISAFSTTQQKGAQSEEGTSFGSVADEGKVKFQRTRGVGSAANYIQNICR